MFACDDFALPHDIFAPRNCVADWLHRTTCFLLALGCCFLIERTIDMKRVFDKKQHHVTLGYCHVWGKIVGQILGFNLVEDGFSNDVAVIAKRSIIQRIGLIFDPLPRSIIKVNQLHGEGFRQR